LPVAGLDDLLSALRDDGWRLVGPRVRDGAIVYDEIATASDLPVGWTDEQDAGRYRFRKRDEDLLTGLQRWDATCRFREYPSESM